VCLLCFVLFLAFDAVLVYCRSLALMSCQDVKVSFDENDFFFLACACWYVSLKLNVMHRARKAVCSGSSAY